MIKSNNIKYKIIVILLFTTNLKLFSTDFMIDSLYNDNIRTIQVYKDGWELSHPIIYLNSKDQLIISFDELGNEYHDYWYSIIHCNSQWEISNISFFDYAIGMENNQITNYNFSTNTVINYIHYSFSFPNENCAPIISGNYLIKVFENNNPDKIIFYKKIYVVENSSIINFQILRPEIPKYMKNYQQFALSVIPNISDYYDLKNEVTTYIYQNFNPITRKKCYLSLLKDNRILIYDNPDSNIFDGINEFRNFDIKSIKYQSPRIKRIEYKNNCYNIELHPDEWRNKKQYFTDQDINGRFFIENTLGVNKNIDADYLLVFFNLPTPSPFLNGNIFLIGDITNWQCDNNTMLRYNFETKSYEINLLLKQGYYNYMYAFKSNDDDKISISYVEGNHYETENEYQVLVYYKSPTSRYERLIGYAVANSLQK